MAAALAEICSVYNKKTILWDLDVETRDLSRSLTVSGVEAKVVSSWVNGEREISRESLKDALIPISSDVSVLMPPDRMAESMDLVCHTDGMLIVQRIIDLARVLYDVVLVDTAGRLGPATGAILRAADIVLIVLDDTVLGITALDLYLSFVKSLVGDTERLVFLVNGVGSESLSTEQIAAELEPAHRLGAAPWRLESIPRDFKAGLWPGSGRTMYSLCQKHTRLILENVAAELGIGGTAPHKVSAFQTASEESSNKKEKKENWVSRLLGR
ncbi:MAG: AAA family ATPase [SAR324 cluster bacterium]|uniref:AAA family ATPase n=1 Tax=SAR324 cluster bacterium TaxID=2024889 RepID=A0A7X9FT60_9DELT|nr:AAA family ATPase [SAR324 cluster bacterium]